MLGKDAALAFVPKSDAVRNDKEIAATSRDHRDLGAWKCFLDSGNQTGRARFVVSNYAVFNGDVHGTKGSLPFPKWRSHATMPP